MPLHPDLESFLELVQMGQNQPMHLQTPAEARASYDAATPLLDSAGEASVTSRDLLIPCRDGQSIAARLYTPANTSAPLPALLFFHGGGYCIGGLASHDALCRDIAHRSPCKVLAIAYRLAPEYKFPQAFYDAEDAWSWLNAHAEQHGIDRAQLAVGGDSAGGTLSTALCIALRNADQPQPCLQILLYPCTSSQQDSPSHQRYAQGFLLESQTLQWMFSHYLNHASERQDWRFAPLNTPDLSAIAPAHIVLAEFDPLLDEGVAYAQQLTAAGVACTLNIYPGMVHDFARLGHIVSDADALRDELAKALNEAFSNPALGNKQT